jgi:hypothetical protein
VYREELQAMIAKKRPEAAAAPAVSTGGRNRTIRGHLGGAQEEHCNGRKPSAQETQPTRKTPERITEIKSKRQSRKAR